MIASLATLLLAAAPPAPLPAAPLPAAPPRPVAETRNATLDRLLAAKDYKAIGKTVSDVATAAVLLSDLDWLKARMMDGRSAFVTMLYARDLWAAAAMSPEGDQLKQTAAMATLYAYAAIAVDGARCGDPSAPAHRADQLAGWNPEVWTYMDALPSDARRRIADIALALEKRTAAARDASDDVEFLCRAGMEETSYNLAHGTSREVPSAPGVIGRTVELTGDGKYRPSVVSEDVRRARAADARATLPATLAVLAKLTPPAR